MHEIVKDNDVISDVSSYLYFLTCLSVFMHLIKISLSIFFYRFTSLYVNSQISLIFIFKKHILFQGHGTCDLTLKI